MVTAKPSIIWPICSVVGFLLGNMFYDVSIHSIDVVERTFFESLGVFGYYLTLLFVSRPGK